MNKEKKALVTKKLLFAFVIFLTVFLDRITKIAAVNFFEKEWDSITAIPKVLDFTYVLNDGAAAGILSEHRWVFMSASAVAIAALILYLLFSKKITMGMGIGFSMILGGGIGNMIDRVATGQVVDFLNVTLVNFFPFNCVFNVADVFVCVGCAVLICDLAADEIKASKNKKTAELKNTSAESNADSGK